MKRIYHHWGRWECFKAGMYEGAPPAGYTADSAKEAYRDFLADAPRFSAAMQRVLDEWPNSCDQFLSNDSINRIAWLGQASMCIDTGVPMCFRGGFKLLSAAQQKTANALAAEFFKKWIRSKANAVQQNQSVHRAMEEARLC